MDNTAIGSVGAISEPNKRQSMYVMSNEDNPNIGWDIKKKVSPPTTYVENKTPNDASNKMVILSFLN